MRNPKQYDIYYNDGAYYGTMTFENSSKDEIEKAIAEEIEDNNKNPNSMYHITRKNFINKTEEELETFIKENSGYWDLNLPDVKEFLLYNKDEIINILQKL
jgi:hypothetical protein